MHSLVNKLSFLPSAVEKRWKRPLLAVLALPITGLGGALVLGSQSADGIIGLTMVVLLGLITIAFGLLGLLVSMFGCAACVAKMLGRLTL
jgi:hypothetical protein